VTEAQSLHDCIITLKLLSQLFCLFPIQLLPYLTLWKVKCNIDYRQRLAHLLSSQLFPQRSQNFFDLSTRLGLIIVNNTANSQTGTGLGQINLTWHITHHLSNQLKLRPHFAPYTHCLGYTIGYSAARNFTAHVYILPGVGH
jgi:hypothetical protein